MSSIDRESEAELRDLYGEVGYTIIDDVLSLPELPGTIVSQLSTFSEESMTWPSVL